MKFDGCAKMIDVQTQSGLGNPMEKSGAVIHKSNPLLPQAKYDNKSGYRSLH